MKKLLIIGIFVLLIAAGVGAFVLLGEEGRSSSGEVPWGEKNEDGEHVWAGVFGVSTFCTDVCDSVYLREINKDGASAERIALESTTLSEFKNEGVFLDYPELEQYQGRIVKIVGTSKGRSKAGNNLVEVQKMETISDFDTHAFMVEQAGEYTLEHLPCLAIPDFGSVIGTKWNKTTAVRYEDGQYLLVVTMQQDSQDSSSDSYELIYDAQTGELLSAEGPEEQYCQ